MDRDEDESLRSVALQTANTIRLARQRADEDLVRAKQALESRTAELERALRDLQTQLDITHVLVNARTIDEVANPILEILCRNLSWRCAQLWRLNRETGRLHRSAGWCDSSMPAEEFQALARFDSLDSGAGLPGRILHSKAPEWVEDIEAEPSFPRASVTRTAGLRSAFGFPLIVSGEVSAVIELFSVQRRTLDDATMKMATALGSHIGQFIERGAAESEQRIALMRLRRLQEITETALANLPLEQLYENLLSKICHAVDADMSVVLMLDEQGNDLRVEAAYGPNTDAVRNFRLRIGESVAGGVAAERRMIIVRNATRDFSVRPELRALGFETILGVPLLARERLIGVLEVGSFSNRDFTDEELDFIHLVGQRVAIAIENSSLYEEAREANRLKDRFLSIASHELKTPLTSILGWIGLLKQADTEEIRRDALRAIEQSARNQAELIEDLLDASRIREGKLVLNRESFDLRSTVSAAVKAVTPAAEQRRVKLQLDLPEAPVLIDGDPARIRQVIWNLLTNAIKFTPEAKRVTARVRGEDGTATITVEDQGEGISPDFLPYIFDALQQEARGIHAGGLGLGLHIVKTIVTLHGGNVEAHSAGPGRGATFIVYLPTNAPK